MINAICLFIYFGILLAVSSASAQTPQSLINQTIAIAELQRAKKLMQHAVSGSASEFSHQYNDVKEAAIIFQKFAPKFIIDDAFLDLKLLLNSVNQASPASVVDIVNYCQHNCSGDMQHFVIGPLLGKILDALLDLEAEKKFGPIFDNPQFYKSITVPTTGFELLSNLKFAFDHSTIRRQDFFTLSNLQRFLGSAPAGIYRSEKGFFARWKSPVPLQIAISCTYNLEGSGPYADAEAYGRYGSLTIACNDVLNTPTFQDVEQVFGMGWTITPRAPPPLPPYPHPDPEKHEPIAYEEFRSSGGISFLTKMNVLFTTGKRSRLFLLVQELL